jgi:membrane associated rhomboid family serine protease
VLGAYALLNPNARVSTLVRFVIFFVVRLRAVVVIGLWFVFQLVNAVHDSGAGGIAYLAHIGGFVAGVVLLYVFKRRTALKSIRRRGPWG